jgi:hypothetical protein
LILIFFKNWKGWNSNWFVFKIFYHLKTIVSKKWRKHKYLERFGVLNLKSTKTKCKNEISWNIVFVYTSEKRLFLRAKRGSWCLSGSGFAGKPKIQAPHRGEGCFSSTRYLFKEMKM